MPYVATTLIACPELICHQGAPLINCPAELLQRFVKDGLAKFEGDPDTVMEGLEDFFIDPLTAMTRKQLIQVYKDNNLNELFVPMSTWTDDQFRQMIRNSTDPRKINLRIEEPNDNGTTS